jgi:dihydroxy-acid dehydratase
METERKLPRLRSDLPDHMDVDYAGARGLMYGCGYSDAQLDMPHIAIVNTWSDCNPGHYHLKTVADAVKKGVMEAGGLPFSFNGVNICDGIVNPPYILPSRDLLVNEIELMVEANMMDAMVLIGTCDKVVPGLLMAAGRLDLPTIIVTGGYMKTGKLDGEPVDYIDVGSSITKVLNGEMSQEKFDRLLHTIAPGPGACGMMGTANTMNMITETIGMSLPGNSTVAAESEELLDIAYRAGKQIMVLWEKQITARQIITPASIQNAIKTCMAIGGSTNTIIHVPAVATETELDMDCGELYAAASNEIPLLVGIRPNGPHCMADFEAAGGLRALLGEIKDHLDLTTLSVNEKTLGENIAGHEVLDRGVIHGVDDPISATGGMALCKGNLVPEGAFIKLSAVPEALRGTFRGRARVFHNVYDATAALRDGRIQAGDAVLIIYQGVKAGPETAYNFTTELKGSPLKDKVIAITDGRLSGAASGACFSYASPEAALRGPLCGVKDGDIIKYDLPNRKLEVELSDEELARRMEQAELVLHPKKGYLSVYQHCVGSVLKGAVLR